MNNMVFTLLMGFASLSFGAQLGYLQDAAEDGGARVILLDEQWECPPGAFKFEVFNRDGVKRVNGCWKGWEDSVLMITETGGKFKVPANKFVWEKAK